MFMCQLKIKKPKQGTTFHADLAVKRGFKIPAVVEMPSITVRAEARPAKNGVKCLNKWKMGVKCLGVKCLNSEMSQVLASLRFLGSGGFFSEVGETAGISRSSLSRILQNFINSVNHRIDNIKFPCERDDILRQKKIFYKLCKLPNIIGAIDGTLVPIIAPKNEPEVYVCRKGYHAINCQAIVTGDMRFIDVVANWPGSTHDSNVFEHSRIKDYLETTVNLVLLGDTGYPLLPYLLTTLRETASEMEEIYNVKHKRGRDVVERAFGILKSRFRCLHRSGGVLPFEPGKCAATFLGCCKLHNMCIDNNDDFEEVMIHDQDDVGYDEHFPDIDRRGQAVREAYIRMNDHQT